MAITGVGTTGTAAYDQGAGNQFTASGPFVFYGDGFAVGECAILSRLGPSGTYLPATNEKGGLVVSAQPNLVYVDCGGTYRVKKTVTAASASVGYEQV